MVEFHDDDAGYMDWLAGHPSGFVVNVRANAGPGYVVLHRASCRHIAAARDDRAYTGRGYRKVVANNLNELRDYSRSLGRWDGSFSRACSHCAPLIQK